MLHLPTHGPALPAGQLIQAPLNGVAVIAVFLVDGCVRRSHHVDLCSCHLICIVAVCSACYLLCSARCWLCSSCYLLLSALCFVLFVIRGLRYSPFVWNIINVQSPHGHHNIPSPSSISSDIIYVSTYSTSMLAVLPMRQFSQSAWSPVADFICISWFITLCVVVCPFSCMGGLVSDLVDNHFCTKTIILSVESHTVQPHWCGYYTAPEGIIYPIITAMP